VEGGDFYQPTKAQVLTLAVCVIKIEKSHNLFDVTSQFKFMSNKHN
jgi:hypothetical protein